MFGNHATIPLASTVALLAALQLSVPNGACAETVLGRDVLWRPREWLIFHMQDQKGTGFRLNITVRDMNVYMQGPRPVLVWIVGPRSNTLVREILPDDGIVSGNERYRDGLYDEFADFRYREWHRLHSPGGYPPGKARSPLLDSPEVLPAREMNVQVPAAGKGLYRVVIIASWDHWISITPDRPIATGVHPGPGPLYVHGDRFRDAYLYVPPNVQDIGISITEEIQPFNWRVQLQDENGKVVGRTHPRTFLSYLVHTPEQGDVIYRLRVRGDTAGACLHIRGVPEVLCPDRASAELVRGGCEVDEKGRVTFHQVQRVLNAWADSLRPEDFVLDVPAPNYDELPEQAEFVGGRLRPARKNREELRELLESIPEILASQDLDPTSPMYGRFSESSPGGAGQLAQVVGWNHPANPYYGHAALVRRVLLLRLYDLRKLSPFFWYIAAGARTGSSAPYDGPVTIEPQEGDLWSLPLRSGWYALGKGSRHSLSGVLMKDVLAGALPEEVIAAWKQCLDLWIGGRSMMHCGEVMNQWAYSLVYFLQVYQFTENPDILQLVREHSLRMTTPGTMGRLSPDATPYSGKSSVGYGRAADLGITGAGYLPEAMGFDGEYTIEQVVNMGKVWREIQEPSIVDWWNKFYYLKTHVTLPKRGVFPTSTFNDTCSPTDFNFRTRHYTHKTGLPDEARDLVVYGDLWRGSEGEPKRPWPCLEEGSFTRVIDNMFFLIKTPAYYSICYGGHVNPDWSNFNVAEVADGSAQLVGYTGQGYGGNQRKAAKPGGLSAVFVPECGPTILGSNSDIWYSNVIWGRRHTPICPKWGDNVDPTIVSSGFTTPHVTFDQEGRVYRKTGKLTYAPLAYTRTISFRDDRIVVNLEIVATDDLDLAELYECIPYFADNRTVRIFDAELREGGELEIMGPQGNGQDVNMDPVIFRAFDLSTASGAGSTVIFDREYTFDQTEPLRYRSVASATRSFNLPLPHQMKAGQRHEVSYIIYSHAQPVSAEQVRRVAADKGN